MHNKEEFPGENSRWTDLLSRLTTAALKLEANCNALQAQNKLLKERLVEEQATCIIEGQPFCMVASTEDDVLGDEIAANMKAIANCRFARIRNGTPRRPVISSGPKCRM